MSFSLPKFRRSHSHMQFFSVFFIRFFSVDITFGACLGPMLQHLSIKTFFPSSSFFCFVNLFDACCYHYNFFRSFFLIKEVLNHFFCCALSAQHVISCIRHFLIINWFVWVCVCVNTVFIFLIFLLLNFSKTFFFCVQKLFFLLLFSLAAMWSYRRHRWNGEGRKIKQLTSLKTITI